MDIAAFPSRKSEGTQLISLILLVNGAAIEASVSLREIPLAAAFKAAQSFAPSPHIPQFILRFD